MAGILKYIKWAGLAIGSLLICLGYVWEGYQVSPSILGFAVWQWQLAAAILFFISVAGILEGYKKHAEGLGIVNLTAAAKVEPKAKSREVEPVIKGRLDEVREKILVLLTNFDNQWIQTSFIAKNVDVQVSLAAYHLHEMHALKLVDECYPGVRSINESTWQIAQNGRAYLVRHKLLK